MASHCVPTNAPTEAYVIDKRNTAVVAAAAAAAEAEAEAEAAAAAAEAEGARRRRLRLSVACIMNVRDAGWGMRAAAAEPEH